MHKGSFDTSKLLDQYQNPPFAMAYGSGIHRQKGYKEEDQKMIDLVFAPEKTRDWHQHNLETHPDDYSWITKGIGINFIEWLQTKGAKIYYHTFIPFDENEIKYGVISLQNLLDDLRHWTTLFVAGRLHKPVTIFKTSLEVEQAISENLLSALRVALLLLPERFTEKQLYETIAGISYTGDPRMRYAAENPAKVQNIVHGNIEEFQKLYQQAISEIINQQILARLHDEEMQQDKDPLVLKEIIKTAPSNLKRHILQKENPGTNNIEQVQMATRDAIFQIVDETNKAQILMGLITAGPERSLRYISAKMEKAKKNR